MGSYSDPALILPGVVGTTELADGAATIAKVDSLIGKFNSGSYTGDGTVNRAIPHGLGIVPKCVMSIRIDSNPIVHFLQGTDTLWRVNNVGVLALLPKWIQLIFM